MYNNMKYGKGKIVNMPTRIKKKNIEYEKIYVYIPAAVAKDSAFPFKYPEEVEVRINPDKTLTIKKID